MGKIDNSLITIRWEFFLERCVAPLRGAIRVDDDATDGEISKIVEDHIYAEISSRITWEKDTVTE